MGFLLYIHNINKKESYFYLFSNQIRLVHMQKINLYCYQLIFKTIFILIY